MDTFDNQNQQQKVKQYLNRLVSNIYSTYQKKRQQKVKRDVVRD